MGGCDQRYVPGPCIACGLPGGAIMGNSEWQHDYMCCGNNCGFTVNRHLEKMRRTKEYKFLTELLADTQGRLADLEAKALDEIPKRHAARQQQKASAEPTARKGK